MAGRGGRASSGGGRPFAGGALFTSSADTQSRHPMAGKLSAVRVARSARGAKPGHYIMRHLPRQSRAKVEHDVGFPAYAGAEYDDDFGSEEEEANHAKRPRGSYNCGKCGVLKRGHGEPPERPHHRSQWWAVSSSALLGGFGHRHAAPVIVGSPLSRFVPSLRSCRLRLGLPCRTCSVPLQGEAGVQGGEGSRGAPCLLVRDASRARGSDASSGLQAGKKSHGGKARTARTPSKSEGELKRDRGQE